MDSQPGPSGTSEHCPWVWLLAALPRPPGCSSGCPQGLWQSGFLPSRCHPFCRRDNFVHSHCPSRHLFASYWLSKGDLTKINANHMAGVKCTDWFRPRGPTWWVRVAENRTSVSPKAVGSAMGRRMRSSHAGRLWRVHHTRLDSLGPLDPSSAHPPCRQRAPRRPAPAPGREQMSLQQTVLGLRRKRPG